MRPHLVHVKNSDATKETKMFAVREYMGIFSHWKIFMIIRSLARCHCTSFLHYWRVGCITCIAACKMMLICFHPNQACHREGPISPFDLLNVSGKEQIGSVFKEEMPITKAKIRCKTIKWE